MIWFRQGASMFLTRIELQGFKSFADKTIIQFDQGVTGIVGPNGCGKSNINDAIRWVLGEQSAKSLRSNTMSDVIFSGSQSRKAVNLAKVSLVFDNRAHIFPIEYDEVEISRSVSRNGDTRYAINQSPCRLKDIMDLVMDTGLGRDSLSIISQGNISSFADAKPEERRALFEEAAGVSKYKKRKKESLSKLEATKENLERLQDIIDELESRLPSLQRQAQKAQKYESLSKELAEIEISVLAEQIYRYQKQLDELKQSIVQDNLEASKCSEELTQLDESCSSLRKQMYAFDGKIRALQSALDNANQESLSLEKRKIELDERRKYQMEQGDVKEKAQQLLSMIAEAKFEYEDRQKRLDALAANSKQKAADLKDIQEKQRALSAQLNSAYEAQNSLMSRKNTLENMMSQPYAHQQGVRAIMNASRSLQGIEGVISSLLTPKEGMADAISNALGGAMYQIATRDEACARAAIAFLKKNRSGRATFLPLSVCRPRYANSVQDSIAKECPGYIGWAYTLVENDARYDDLRDRLLGNILVMDTLEHANACAKALKYAIKIVTPEGDVVHAGGSMSGGSQKHQSNPMALKPELEQVSKKLQMQNEQISILKRKQNQLSQNFSVCQNEHLSLQIEFAKLENLCTIKKEKYLRFQAEYNALDLDDKPQVQTGTNDLLEQLAKAHAKVDELGSNMQMLRKQRYELGEQCEQMEEQMRKLRRQNSALLNSIHQNELKQATISTRQESALMRLNSDYQMTYEFALSQKKELDMNQASAQVEALRKQIAALGHVNLDAPAEYEQVKERFDFLSHQKEDLLAASAQIEASISEMDETMKVQFTQMFYKINEELQESFAAMFGGGKARLSMTNPDDVLNTGIEIEVQPPGKLVKNLQAFSGGEKALIAISVLFAILKARTVPLCIFDEVEAALDQANVERFAKYLSHF
jgi:chromosome segregation protein